MRAAAGLAFTALAIWVSAASSAAESRKTGKVPVFRVDPGWPKVPSQWVLGEVSGVAVDAKNNIWILQRPRTLRLAQKAMAAPPVMVFRADGTYIKGWGGPHEGYEWPDTEHGIFIDYKGFVWIGGSGRGDNQILKFTQDGRFVLQIGHSGQSQGNHDPVNMNRPADQFVYPGTNELFVADGYGNRRVIVFDADTGAFRRMWGAFGNEALDPPPRQPGRGPAPREPEGGSGPQQFNLVHAARVSNDGLVYVSDRGNKRIQVFTLEGKFVKQVFIGRGCYAPECGNGQTAASTAFSPDKEQKFLYVADRSEGKLMVLDRKSLDILYSFGKVGFAPGEFNVMHHMAIDHGGNLYTTEVNDNFAIGECCRRVQKFVYLGMGKPPMP